MTGRPIYTIGYEKALLKDVLATLTLDESVALLVRKPLHGALSQATSSFKTCDGPGTEPPLLIQRAGV